MIDVRRFARFLCFGTLAVTSVLAGYAVAYGGNHSKSGPKSSDPRLDGPRDMNYD